MPALKHLPIAARCSRRVRKTLSLGAFAAVCLTLGCARLPPGQNILSGRRIHVVMRFRSPLNPNFYYFFLINKYGTQGTNGARGPVPVIGRAVNGGYGNGFATGSIGGGVGNVNGVTDYGLTDYVLFHTPGQYQGLNLYHITGDPNGTQAGLNPIGQPLTPILPSQSDTDPSGSETLQFDLDMSQLVSDTNVTSARISEGQQIQYLQVNIVATNITPTDPTTNALKEVDSFGDTLSSSDQNAFLQIDLSQSRTYSSGGDNVSGLTPELTGDVYPPGSLDQSLDLEFWSITVQPHS